MLIPSRESREPPSYTQRRDEVASLATGLGSPPIEIDYREEEHATWSKAMAALAEIWERRAALPLWAARQELGLPEDRIPQLAFVTERLRPLTGFSYASVPGIVSRVDFFGALRRAIFPSTQFIRWAGNPEYTPAPDVLHEVGGHAIALANEHLAELHRAAGRAAKATKSPTLLSAIAAVFWYTAEFGVVRSPKGWKAYGAGLLSSPGELNGFAGHAEIRPITIAEMITTPYDIHRYQPILFGAESLEEVLDVAGRFFDDIARRIEFTGEQPGTDPGEIVAASTTARSLSA